MKYENIKQSHETAKCLLCYDAPCKEACPHELKVAEVIRALRFENHHGAANLLPDKVPCITCTNPSCMASCNRQKIDEAVQIPALMQSAARFSKGKRKPNNLKVTFCNVQCENPFFLSSSIVASNAKMIAKAFEMGWAGVAFKTIGCFVPEEVSPRFDKLKKEDNPFVGLKNIEQISDHTLEENVAYIKQLKKDYPTKVIIASIMGRNEAEWTHLAAIMEEAGADIIECNFSCPHMSGSGLGSDVGTNPELVARYTKAVRKGTKLPILAKMTPNITNMEVPAMAAVQAGADGIAAINTIKSIVNVDLESFSAGPDVKGKTAVGGYSGKAVKPIALRFIHDMKKCEALKDIPISGMGGIETWKDAAEFLAMGCGTVQVTTAVMQYGYRIIEDLIDGLSCYLEEKGFDSVEDLIGRALPNILPAEELDRKSICYPKFNKQDCVGCGRCYLACYDAGHQALRIDEKTHKPLMDPKKCVGCHLCALVCPVEGITPGARVTMKENKAFSQELQVKEG